MGELTFFLNKIALVVFLFFPSPSFCEQNERIITDLRTLYSKFGVDIDYRYNETHYNSNGLSSVPGCPKSVSRLPWIYYGNPKRCYLAHFTGPCAKGEMLITQNGSPYGICGCECMTLNPDKYVNLNENKDDLFLGCKDDDAEISKNFNFGQVFNIKEQKCYGMFSTGPCQKSGEVITAFTRNTITCKPLCNRRSPDWTELYRKQLCALEPSRRTVERDSITGSINPKSCGRNTRYSEALQKCIRQVTVSFQFGQIF